MKQIIFTGHLGKDSEILPQKEGDKHFVLSFSVAHTEKYKNILGEDKSNTTWFSCFKRYKENPLKVKDILKKGFKVAVIGKPSFSLQTANSGVYINIAVNATNIDFMSKAEDTAE